MSSVEDGSDGVVVVGVGRVSAAPDVVRISLAAEGVAPAVQDALGAATAGVEAMRAALVGGGVARADVRTTHTSLWSDAGPDGRGPTRYVARLGLEATVRDVPTAGALLTAALTAAGDTARMDGIAPGHSDDAALAVAAREVAFADARAKAGQYAELAGRALGVVRSVVEGGGGGGPRSALTMSARAEAQSIAVEPGELEVAAVVTVHYAWAP